MKAILDYLNRRTSVNAAAIVIATAFLASRLLGLLRDRLLAAHFGVGATLDAYTAAFRLPELLFTLLVSGAFAVAFIPIAAEHIEKGRMKQLRELASTLFNLLVIATLVLAGLAWIFASPLVTLVTPGFDAQSHQLTVELTRIMLITPTLFAISSVLGGIAQSFGRFVVFATASVFYNLGIIFGILWLVPSSGIEGVAYGVVIGAAAQALIQLLGLAGLGFHWQPRLNLRRRDVRQVVKLMIPRSIDQGIDQIHYLIETILGSRLATGSLTSLYYANNLKNVPLALIGNSIATAAFPRLAARSAQGAIGKLIDEFVQYTTLILFLTLPAAAIAILLRGYLVRLIYGFGDPTTAATLGWFAGTIVFEALFFLVCRMFYALKDTRTPLFVSLSSILVGVALSYGLSEVYGVVGLAAAQSILGAFELTILFLLLRRRLHGVGGKRIISSGSRMVLATLAMSAAIYYTVSQVAPLQANDVGFAVVAPKVLIITGVAFVTYFVAAYLLRLREARQLWTRVWAQMSRPISLPRA